MRRLALPILATLIAAGLPAQEPTAGRRYAVLVGVNDYDHAKFPDLRFAEADAAKTARLLSDHGFEVALLTGAAGKTDAAARPTLANLRARLDQTLRRSTKRDLVLIGLAGHGLQFDNEAFFCPADGRPFAEEKATLLSLKTLYEQLDRSGAGVKLLLVDACRDDPQQGRGRGVDGDSAPRPPAGVAALFSCSAGERAFESDRLGHGVFFHRVLRGLEGAAKNARGEVTWDALQAYVRDEVTDEVGRLIGGGAKQTPSLNAGELRGRSPVLVKLTAAAASNPPPKAKPAEPKPPAKGEPAPTLVRDVAVLDGTKFAHFGPDGPRVLVTGVGPKGGADQSWWVMDPAAGRVVAGPMTHDQNARTAVLSADGRLVLTGSNDGTAVVWDAATALRRTTLKYGSPVNGVALSPDGRYALAWNLLHVNVWDAETGAVVGNNIGASPVAFTPDGHRAALPYFDGSGNSPGLRFWHTATWRLPGRTFAVEGGLTHLGFSPDGTRLVAVDTTNAARLYDVDNARSATGPLRHAERIVYAAFAPDGRRVATASTDGTARVWDAKTGSAVAVLKHDDWVHYAAFSPDGSLVVTASSDKTARVWNAATGAAVAVLRHEIRVTKATFTPDGRRVVTSTGGMFAFDHTPMARLWDARTGQLLGTAKAPK